MKVIIASFLTLFLATCSPQPQQSEPVKDGVFIHITRGYENAHEVLMPMKMATIMAQDYDVVVYLDIHAVNLVVSGAEDLTHDGFESFKTYLDQLKSKNITVMACPTCLQISGYTQENLVEGVTPADKSTFFNFTKGRILTLDY